MIPDTYYRLITFGTPEYDAEIALRMDVLRIPLRLEFDTEDLSLEYQDFHQGAFDNKNNLRGCLVMTPQENGIVKMRQFAVAEAAQGQGIGTGLVHFAEEWAGLNGFKRIELHARKTAVPFYLRLNYKTKGEEFIEVTIPHLEMYKDLK